MTFGLVVVLTLSCVGLVAAGDNMIEGCHAGLIIVPFLQPSELNVTCVKSPGYLRFEALTVALKGRPKARSVEKRDATSLQGAIVTGQMMFPNTTRPVGTFFTAAPVPATGVDVLGLYGLAVAANTVTFAWVGPVTAQTSSFTTAEFNGPVLTVLSGAPPIINAVISSATPNWSGAALTFDATHVFLNMQSLIQEATDSITVTLTFPAIPTE